MNVYKVKSLALKIFILIAILALTVVTFETIFSGLERNTANVNRQVVILDNEIKKRLDDENNINNTKSKNLSGYPYPIGLNAQIFSFSALEKTWKNAKLPSEREHVSPYMMKNSDIFTKIAEKTSCGPSINHKTSKDELMNYFRDILPEYDEDRVYISDIKKVIQWYNIMQSVNLIKISKKKTKKETKKETE